MKLLMKSNYFNPLQYRSFSYCRLWNSPRGYKGGLYSGKDIFVYADETRPRLQGARLTAWELLEEGIPCKLIADSAAATLIRDKKIDLILVGADRIALMGIQQTR